MFKGFRSIVITFLALCFIPLTLAWTIEFTSPSDGMYSNYVNRDYIVVNVTSSASNTTNITIDIYDSEWSLINTNTSFEEMNELFVSITGLSEGIYYINVTATDNESTTEYTSTNVTIDMTNTSIWYESPTDNGTRVNRKYIIINYTANDTNLDNVSIYTYNSTFDVIYSVTNTTSQNYVNYYINHSVSVDDTYYFNATAYDKAGNLNYAELLNVTIDTTAPDIEIVSPSNINYADNTILIDISVIASDADTIWFFNGTDNETYIGPKNITFNEGENTIYAWVNDSMDNINTTNVSFIIDTIEPTIMYEENTDNITLTNKDYILINVTANDTNLNYTIIKIYNSTGQLINSTINTGINTHTNYTVPKDDTYYYNATTYDLAGYSSSTGTRNITIDTTAPYFTSIPANATINYDDIWAGVDFDAADDTAIDTYSVNDSSFTIDGTGYLNDVPTLGVGIYVLNITINDTLGHKRWITYKVTVQNVTAPTITMNSPTNNYNSSKNYIILNITIYDSDLDNMTVRFYGGGVLRNTTYNRINGTTITYNWTGLSEGTHNWTAIANDGTSNSTTQYYYFRVDTTRPSIIINNPTATIYNTSTILINITSADSYLDEVWFYNGAANQTYTGPVNITYTEGTHTITAWANDTLGNINSTNKTFTVSINYAPSFTINSPSNSSTITTNYSVLSITVNDEDADNMTVWFYGDGVLRNTTYNRTNGTTITYNWTGLSEGTHNWTAIVRDGTINTTSGYLYFMTNTSVPVVETPESPGGSNRRNTGSGSSGSDYVYVSPANSTSSNIISFNKYVYSLKKGNQTMNIDMAGMPITYLSMNINSDVNISDTLKLISQPNNPTNTSINASIFKYMLINTTAGQYIDGISFKFKINRSWITQHNLTTNNISIYYYDNQWIKVKVSKDSEDTGYIYYSSSINGTRNFAIGGPIIQKIEAKKTLIQEEPQKEIITSNAVSTDASTKQLNNKGFLGQVKRFLTNAKDNAYTFIINLDADIQELIVITVSSILILIVGVVSGVLVYKNTIKPRKIRDYNKKIVTKKPTPYETEAPLTQTATEPPSKTINVEQMSKDKETPVLPSKEFSLHKVNELTSQCEYALDNGRVEEAKKYYDEARSIYFNSGLDYKEKSKVYTKIIELHNRLNKK